MFHSKGCALISKVISGLIVFSLSGCGGYKVFNIPSGSSMSVYEDSVLNHVWIGMHQDSAIKVLRQIGAKSVWRCDTCEYYSCNLPQECGHFGSSYIQFDLAEYNSMFMPVNIVGYMAFRDSSGINRVDVVRFVDGP